MFRKICILGIATLLTLFLSSSTYTQVGPNARETTVVAVTGDIVTPTFNINEAYEISRFKVETTAGGVFISIQDAGMPTYPDWWEVTVYKYGAIPYKVMTTPKPTSGYAGKVICYAVGSGAQIWYVEIRYHRGVNVFPAGGYIKFDAPGGTVTATPITVAP